MNVVKKYFGIDDVTTTLKTEVLAGVTAFLTMAYIVFVNPSILAEAGMDSGAVFIATCLAATIGCLIMSFFAKKLDFLLLRHRFDTKDGIHKTHELNTQNLIQK